MGTMEAREDLHLEFWNAPQRWAGPSHPHKDAGAEGIRVWGVMRRGWSFKAGGVCAEVWILWAQATLAVTEFSAGWNLVLNLVAVMETSSGTYVFKKVGNRPRTPARLLAGSVPFCSHSRAQQPLNLREVPFFWRLFLSPRPFLHHGCSCLELSLTAGTSWEMSPADITPHGKGPDCLRYLCTIAQGTLKDTPRALPQECPSSHASVRPSSIPLPNSSRSREYQGGIWGVMVPLVTQTQIEATQLSLNWWMDP